MDTDVELNRLIDACSDDPDRRPCIAETGVTIRRVAQWYWRGNSAEDIAGRIRHLSLAQVYAALAYYHANRDVIDDDLSREGSMGRTFLDDQTR
jgi:uncharacterized protein (DUF433 family)